MKGKIIIKPFSTLFIFLLFALLLFLWKNLRKEGFFALKSGKAPRLRCKGESYWDGREWKGGCGTVGKVMAVRGP